MTSSQLLTAEQVKKMGYGLREMQDAAKESWLAFETDSASETGERIPQVAAKRQTWNSDFLSYAITINGELSDIEMGFFAVDNYNIDTVLLHHLDD